MNITVKQIECATKKQLDEFAKELGIKGYSRISKADLEAKLITMVEVPQTETTEEKADTVLFFERVAAMTELSDIQQACEELAEKLKLEGMQPKSRSNKLAPYSKLFKNLQPTPETHHLFFPYKAEGKTEFIQRHLYFKYMGLADISWKEVSEDTKERRQERQAKSSNKDELAAAMEEPNKVFNLDLYLKTTIQLLNSNDPHELAIGLIAASGRRPSEIIMLSEFSTSDWIPSYIKNPTYGVKVVGLAKKRDKEIITYTSLLVPTTEFLERIDYLRSLPLIKSYQEKFQKLLALGYDKEYCWKKIEDSIGKELRDTTDLYFAFLPKIDDGQNRKNILLRACTTKLLTMRDYPTATSKARVTYAGVMAGHIIPEFKADGSVGYHGETSASTLHYDDYEPNTSEIPFLCDVVIQRQPQPQPQPQETEDMARIAELESVIEQLKTELAQKNAEITELKERINRPKLPQQDVSEMDSKRLFSTRKEGSAEEKLNRAWQAITAYNDNTPEYKICPTNKVLRELTGVNGQTVTKWMEQHNDEIVSHLQKHDMNKISVTAKGEEANYYNNRYRNKTDMNTEIILEIISKEYLQ
jgi:hypothetical protein